MVQTVSLDSQTLIIKSDDESELLDIIEFISKKQKQDNLNIFLNFVANNRKIEENFKFNRDECYGR